MNDKPMTVDALMKIVDHCEGRARPQHQERRMSLPEQLRAWCIAVRRKPSPIADAIPMVNKAADEIDRLTADYAAATHLLADRDAQIERLKAELATLRASAASVQADQRAEIDAARALRKGTTRSIS